MAEWIRTALGETTGQVLVVVIGLVVVLALIGLFLRLSKMISSPGFRSKNMARLGVLEAVAVDTKRRLVLVKCDQKEHLILIGGDNDLVVDNDVRNQSKPVETQPNPRQVVKATNTETTPEIQVNRPTTGDSPVSQDNLKNPVEDKNLSETSNQERREPII